MTREERGRYYASREWALLKEQVKQRSGGKCERCRVGDYEQTHHLTYARWGHELLEDLLAVCEPCHLFLSGKSHDDPLDANTQRPAIGGRQVSHNGHGQSSGTSKKEGMISGLLGWELKQAKRARADDYFYIDLNAGPGWNHGSIGTPIGAVRRAKAWQLPHVHMLLIEKNSKFVERLERNVIHEITDGKQRSLIEGSEAQIHPYFLNMDNEEAIDAAIEWVPMVSSVDTLEAPGFIVSDPNGTNNGAVSIHGLSKLLHYFPRFALVVHFYVGGAKRVRGYHHKHPELPSYPCPRVADYLSLRPYWLVSERWGEQQAHICIAGFKCPTPDWQNPILWHYATSARGREILTWADADRGRSKEHARNGIARLSPALP